MNNILFKILMLKGDAGEPTDEQTQSAVDDYMQAHPEAAIDETIINSAVGDWLDDHPEATTTVQDESLTYKKMVKGTMGFVTPQMFGAKGDGVANDTQAFKEMLLSDIDMIIIPEGTYYIDEGLIFPTGKDVTCVGLLKFHDVATAITLGNTELNKFNIRSLRITSDSFDESSIGIKILDCIESNFSNLFANLFGTNIYVTAENGVSAYNTFINPIATRGKYNFKIYGPTSPIHCNENYIFGGRLFSSSDTVRQMSIEGYAGSWSVSGLSAEGAGECAIYCDTAYCSFYQIRTEGTWSSAGIVFGSNSDRNRVFSTRYDATIEDNGSYNTYITNRMGTKLLTTTSNVPALQLNTAGGSAYSALRCLVNGVERFIIRGDNTIESFVMHITQSGWNFSPLKLGTNRFWINDGKLWTKNGAPESATDGSPVGREYRSFYQSPVGVLQPYFVGDEVLDTTNNKWYKATGTTTADWVALN